MVNRAVLLKWLCIKTPPDYELVSWMVVAMVLYISCIIIVPRLSDGSSATDVCIPKTVLVLSLYIGDPLCHALVSTLWDMHLPELDTLTTVPMPFLGKYA